MIKYKPIFFSLIALLFACSDKDDSEQPAANNFEIQTVAYGTISLSESSVTQGVAVDQGILIRLNAAVDRSQIDVLLKVESDNILKETTISYLDNDQTILLKPNQPLNYNTVYRLSINSLSSTIGEVINNKTYRFKTASKQIELLSVTTGNDTLNLNAINKDILLSPSFKLKFSVPLDSPAAISSISIQKNGINSGVQMQWGQNASEIIITPEKTLEPLTRYQILVAKTLAGQDQEAFGGKELSFYTELGNEQVFPELTDDQLLTKVQEQTFKYFWDLAEPNSGMARERNSSGNIVTVGGSGFGLMAIVVGVERGFITRTEALTRFTKIIDFLTTADRFHGAWPHWLDGNTGDVIPFSANDDGGDLVETSFMVQGLLTVRQYLDDTRPEEKEIIDNITALWEAVEWDWYTRGGEKVLYWHWSPNYGWAMNHTIKGWNEALITYVLAASSPTHSIDLATYQQGWASNGAMANGHTFYNYTLPLGDDKGGPLFFAHYSFLGLDPRNLEDQYANYWTQNKNHTLINYSYCVENPENYIGYNSSMWGITASDNYNGYSAHSPTNDLGVITPTAALSSLPYTPEYSLTALHTFYYLLGDKLWGNYGFYDAFSYTEQWVADSYLAIDQGPIIIMIENYRTGLLWQYFMENEEVKNGLEKLNFKSY